MAQSNDIYGQYAIPEFGGPIDPAQGKALNSGADPNAVAGSLRLPTDQATSSGQAPLPDRPGAIPNLTKYGYTGAAPNFGSMPTVDRTGFEAFKPKTTLGSVNGYDDTNSEGRTAQSRLLKLLENASQGNGPSAAQSQLRAGTDANINAALSMAASQRGGANPSASRAALMSMGAANQQQANQSAILRAQETQSAYGLMGTTAGQLRDSDTKIGLANMEKNLQLAVEQGRISSAEAQMMYKTNADALMKEAELRNSYNTAIGNAGVAQRGQDINAGVTQRGQDISSLLDQRGQNINMRGQDINNNIDWYKALSGNVWAGENAAADREKNRIAGRDALTKQVAAGASVLSGAAGAYTTLNPKDPNGGT